MVTLNVARTSFIGSVVVRETRPVLNSSARARQKRVILCKVRIRSWTTLNKYRRRVCSHNGSSPHETEDDCDEENSAEKSQGVRAALWALQWYKDWVSPILPSSCRFVPSCSSYSKEAYTKFGVLQGTILTAWRLLRCNPFIGKGWEYDPPDKWQKIIFQREKE